jgi:hypothetical protein
VILSAMYCGKTELKFSIRWSRQHRREALLRLSDPGQPEDLSARSALHLGAPADKKYEPLLKQVTSDLVRKAAQIALRMMEESAGLKRPGAKHSSFKHLIFLHVDHF